MELFEDRVQPCLWTVFKCQAFGLLRTLYTGLAKNIKSEISVRNMEKYRTARRLIILSLVTSLQERQRHWQFALQFLFAALHGQQPRPIFRAQAPLHGQETSTDPWSYLTRMANLMNGWKRGGSTFSPSSKYSQRFFVFLFSNNRSISVYCLGIYKIIGFIWFHAGLKRIELF